MEYFVESKLVGTWGLTARLTAQRAWSGKGFRCGVIYLPVMPPPPFPPCCADCRTVELSNGRVPRGGFHSQALFFHPSCRPALARPPSKGFRPKKGFQFGVICLPIMTPSPPALPGWRKPVVLRPGIVGMRGSMVIRLRPCTN